MALRRRHLAKAVTYRTCGTIITCVVAYCLTGSIKISLILAPIDLVIKTALYYLHEHVWHMVKWGIKPTDET